jgi:hypothetical protein
MDSLSESDVSTHLSYLLQRPISFKLRITPNKELALIDVAILFTGLDNNHAGLAVRRLLAQFPDVHSNRVNFKFPGRGQKEVEVAPLAEAIEFAFLLPGRAASRVRKEAAKLLVRYLGGDLSLVDEVCQINRVQAALAQIPEEERTAEQQAARLFGESVENTTMKLTIVPAPEGLVPSSNQRDAYVMRVLDATASQFWKIGRSDDPLLRADQLDCQMRRDGLCWHHEVDTIFRHGGIMESLLHREFQGMRMDNTKEYFRGPADFPRMVARAMVALLPKQMELQFQDRRKSETRGGLEEVKRRKFELELARDELSLKKDQAKFDADARVASANADADARVASAKADADARVASAKADADTREIIATADANVTIIIAKAEAEACRIRGSAEPKVDATQPLTLTSMAEVEAIGAQPSASAVVDQPTAERYLTGLWAAPGGAQFLKSFRMAKRGRRYPTKVTDLYLRGGHLGDDALGFLQENPFAFQMAKVLAQTEARRHCLY